MKHIFSPIEWAQQIEKYVNMCDRESVQLGTLYYLETCVYETRLFTAHISVHLNKKKEGEAQVCSPIWGKILIHKEFWSLKLKL